ncbi:MAG TPA: hypothetical protein VFT95_15130, partial [Micromonosporaceae bacterium]|nr:hypothetical protein [Micromonosporaceae bacterium]
GPDLTDPAAFDADSSPARRRAAASNAGQLTFDGMPEPAVVHLVWSGTPESGLTAVHIGRLVYAGGDKLEWSVLLRVDESAGAAREIAIPRARTGVGYVDQPLPEFDLLVHPAVRADEG